MKTANEDFQRLDHFNLVRLDFLTQVSRKLSGTISDEEKPVVVLITHLLPDRPALVTALNNLFEVVHIFGIPYSTDTDAARWLGNRFPLSQPTLTALLSGECIEQVIMKFQSKKVILMDIGSYGALIIRRTREAMRGHMLGVIEGADSGIRRYIDSGPHSLPIVGMSMSPIKSAESTLVGESCLFSIDRILRTLGFSNEVRNVTVLGYGRVGVGVAAACKSRGYSVSIFDTNDERRLQALADGFLIPSRGSALASADLVLAATGRRSWSADDAQLMREGAFLASCSSKDIEYGYSDIAEKYGTEEPTSGINVSLIQGRRLNFIYAGHPVNFRDGANLGPILTLVQAEAIASCLGIALGAFQSGVNPPNETARAAILKQWIQFYVDEEFGWFSRRTAIEQDHSQSTSM